MTPNNENYEETMEDDFAADFELRAEPSKTYAANLEKARFIGKIDETEAVKQAVMKMIQTERYEYEIYSWDYGIELQDLFGKPIPYVMSEVKQRITDALLADDRIELVGDFLIERAEKNVLHCSFSVTTTQGDTFEIEKEVEV